MNPEIRRYSWLELTSTRAVIAPAVIGLLVVSILRDQGPQTVLYWLNGLAGFCCVWGMGQCSLSVSEEVVSGTWDWQRLSPQNAMQLAIGKIVGAPVFQWFCFAVCAFFYFFVGLQTERTLGDLSQWLYRWVTLLLLAYSFAVMSSIESARPLRAVRRPGGRFRAGIVFFFLVSMAIPGVIASLDRGRAENLLSGGAAVIWYGFAVPLARFVDLSLLVFAAWSIGGCYRSMKSELQFRCTPWFWCAFLLFLTIYFTPLLSIAPTPFLFSAVLFAITSVAAYLNLVREDKDIVTFRRLLAGSDRGFPVHLIPCWAVSLCLMFAGLAGIYLFEGTLPGGSLPNEYFRIFCCIATLFLIRDGSLLLAIHIRNPRHARNDLAVLFYLFCLYFLVPTCLRLIGSVEATRFFWPVREKELSYANVLWATPLAAASLIFFLTSLKRTFRRQ